MANPDHVAIVRQGAEAIAKWRTANPNQRIDLRDAELSGADLRNADLTSANLQAAKLIRTRLSLASLDGSNLAGADLSDVESDNASFKLAKLDGANLSNADLNHADFCSAWMPGANLRDADLHGAVLRSTNLSEANLVGVKLYGHADLSGVKLRRSDLSFGQLQYADLRLAVLCEAKLNRTDLTRADLKDANLRNCVLTGATLCETRLLGADLTSSGLGDTILSNLDLNGVIGLDETIRHSGPSSVGVDTLYKSHGRISATFLRDCGVPDNLIEFLPSLLGSQQAVQFYSCFISYSHKDEEFAERLHGRMRDKHLRVWYAPEDMKGGEKLHDQIDLAIRVHDKLLIVLSENSMSSEWVKTEVRKARKREETEGKRVLFPIRLVPFEAIRDWEAFDADTGKDMAVELREYFIPDFSNWKDHDAFESAFKRLLEDLNRDDKSP